MVTSAKQRQPKLFAFPFPDAEEREISKIAQGIKEANMIQKHKNSQKLCKPIKGLKGRSDKR